MKLLYPGSFDPPTKGHLDVIWRAAAWCDKLVVAIADNDSKCQYLTGYQRHDLLRRDIENFNDEKRKRKIDIHVITGLTIKYAFNEKCDAIVRGVRDGRDAASEMAMWMVNSSLYDTVDEILVPCRQALLNVSSSAVKALLAAGCNERQLWRYVTGDTARWLVSWRDEQEKKAQDMLRGTVQCVPCKQTKRKEP